jgi:cytochrome P450 family 710 subfamily A protein
MLMVLHPSAKTILGANNLAFMHGPGHKAIRKSFLSLFTRKALSTYTQVQDGVIRSHLARWLQLEPGTREIREHCRWEGGSRAGGAAWAGGWVGC